jgi:hypothetical protein
VTVGLLRELALALPGVEEGTSYGTVAFRVRGRLLARLREDGESLVVRVEMDERDLLIESDPAVFFTTDHYRGYPSVLVRLSKIRAGALRALLAQAWRRSAPKRLIAVLDAELSARGRRSGR